MKPLILLSALWLTGCIPANALNHAKLEYLCRDHGGVYRLRHVFASECNDGTSFDTGTISKTVIKDPDFFPSKEK